MADRMRLSGTVRCPLSGTKWGRVSIPSHTLALATCKDDHGLYAKCREHGIRVLIGLPSVVAMIRNSTKIVGPVVDRIQELRNATSSS